MTRRDHPDTDGHSRNEDAERPGRPRPAPSNVVDLGTDVGTEPPGGSSPTGFDASEPPAPERRERMVVDRTGREPDGGSRRRSLETHAPERSAGSPGIDGYSSRTYRSRGGLAVVAELSEVREEDLSTGIDVRSNQLVISVEGRSIDRIPLPWSSTAVAAVRFDDGILEARLEPAGDGGFEPDREGCV